MFIKKVKLFQNSSSFAIDKTLFRGIITFFSNIVRTRMFNIDAKRGPLFVSWMCTYRCNANCRFCGTDELSKKYLDDLSLERALEIAHEIGRAKTWVVGFTGGEVFLWPHLFKVIKVLKRYKVNVYIITNSLLLKQNVDKIIDAGVDTIVVSIDSCDPREHDDNRRVTGLYDAAMDGIQILKARRKGKKPVIKSMTVLSRKNYFKIEEIISHLAKIVDATSIQPVVTNYINFPHQVSAEEEKSFFLEGEEKKSVVKALRKLADKHPSFNNFYFKSIPDYWFNPMKLFEVKCWAPFVRMTITPQADVIFCAANPRYAPSFGNLKNMTVMEAWNSPIIKKCREEIRRDKNQCVCWSQDASFNCFMHSLPVIKNLPLFKSKFSK